MSELFPGRYAVFGCDSYYPVGGFDDCVARVGTREEAEEIARNTPTDYKEVIDLIELAQSRYTEDMK